MLLLDTTLMQQRNHPLQHAKLSGLSCHTWMSHVTHEWVMSHMNEFCHVWMSHVTHEWVMSHMNVFWEFGVLHIFIWYRCVCSCMYVFIYICKYMTPHPRIDSITRCNTSNTDAMGWLRLVGSLKLYVSFAEYRVFYRALLQNKPII